MSNNIPFFIGRTILSVLLAFSLALFLLFLSLNQEINENNFESVIGKLTLDVMNEKVKQEQDVIGGINFELVHEVLVKDCDGKENILVDEINMVILCEDINNAGVEGLEELFEKELGKSVSKQIEQGIINAGGLDSLSDAFRALKIGMVICGILSLVLIIGIVFLSVPKYLSMFNLGFVGLFAGAPFAVAKTITFTTVGGQLNTMELLVTSIKNNLFWNYLIAFIIGVLLLIVGLIWWAIKGRKYNL